MTLLEATSTLLLALGVAFFVAGTVGLLRFPDVYTRLHALTKADNLGLGFVVLGLMLQAEAWSPVLELLLVWVLALAASATICQLVAGAALHLGVRAWRGHRRRDDG